MIWRTSDNLGVQYSSVVIGWANSIWSYLKIEDKYLVEVTSNIGHSYGVCSMFPFHCLPPAFIVILLFFWYIFVVASVIVIVSFALW